MMEREKPTFSRVSLKRGESAQELRVCMTTLARTYIRILQFAYLT
jgi:hypothetical protein